MAAVSGNWSSIDYGGGRWVAVEFASGTDVNGQIATSTDGKNWSTQTLGTDINVRWSGVAYNGNNAPNAYKWVAVGYRYLPSGPVLATGVIAISKDGITWSVQDVGPRITWDRAIRGETSGKFFVLGSEGNIAISSNGTDWTIQQVGTNSWNAGVYCSDKRIIVGYDSQIATSFNGTSWTITTVGSGSIQWTDVAFRNDIRSIVAVGQNGYIATSLNGTDWTVQKVGILTWEGIAYGNGLWMAVGTNSYMATSIDGMNWTNSTHWSGVAAKND
jgi:hypothetical protein